MKKSVFDILYRNPISVYIACAICGLVLASSILFMRVKNEITHIENSFLQSLKFNAIEFDQRFETLTAQLVDAVDFARHQINFASESQQTSLLLAWKRNNDNHFRYQVALNSEKSDSAEVFALSDALARDNAKIQRNSQWYAKELRLTEQIAHVLPFIYHSSRFTSRVYYTSFSALAVVYPVVENPLFYQEMEAKFELGLSLPFYHSGPFSSMSSKTPFITEVYQDPILETELITLGMPLIVDNYHLGNFGIDFEISAITNGLLGANNRKVALVLGNQSFITANSWALTDELAKKALNTATESGLFDFNGSRYFFQKLKNDKAALIEPIGLRDLYWQAVLVHLPFASIVVLVGFTCFFVGLSTIKQAIARLNNALTLMDKRAHIDELTNIANRRHFSDIFNDVYAQSCKTESQFSLMLLDIDNFKKINDQHGHLVGDTVLQEFCRVVQANIRKSDQFARWGGEEFILLPSSHENINQLAEKIRLAVAHTSFTNIPKLTVSIGAVQCDNAAVHSKNSLLDAADKALYQAKDNGRNNTVIAIV